MNESVMFIEEVDALVSGNVVADISGVPMGATASVGIGSVFRLIPPPEGVSTCAIRSVRVVGFSVESAKLPAPTGT